MFLFSFKIYRKALSGLLCPDPLWEIAALPKPYSWIKVWGHRGEGRQWRILAWANWVARINHTKLNRDIGLSLCN